MTEIIASYGHIILFLHVISAVIWVGGMIAIRFAVHPAMSLIATTEVRLSRSLHLIRRFFYIVIPFIVTLLLTGILLIYGFGHKGQMAVHIKETIWLIMALNFVTMFIRRNKAEKLLKDSKLDEAKHIIYIISAYMIPVNIIFGLIAIYLGIFLRAGI